MLHFPRPALAAELVAALEGRNVFGDAPNGLFLTAPRRTGKSTFLQVDLKPALERKGVLVVYVDLWSDLKRDPGELIAHGIGEALHPHLGKLAKLAKGAGLSKVALKGWLEFDPGRVGRLDGATLPEALRALHAAAGAPVALVIDEAQHALSSEAGEIAMTALKAARDQLNAPGRVNLMLVLSGSDRDKLLRLVNSAAAPFYGSQVQRMPLLGEDFIEFVARRIELQRPKLKPVDARQLAEAFAVFGSRPQFFMEALGQVLSPLSGLESRPEAELLRVARERQVQDQLQMASDYLGLRPLQRAILWRLLERGARFRPYDAAALKFYAQAVGKRVSAAQAQAALEQLRERQPPLVWKSARGEYAVDDVAMHAWYEELQRQCRWPPAGPAAPGAGD